MVSTPRGSSGNDTGVNEGRIAEEISTIRRMCKGFFSIRWGTLRLFPMSLASNGVLYPNLAFHSIKYVDHLPMFATWSVRALVYWDTREHTC